MKRMKKYQRGYKPVLFIRVETEGAFGALHVVIVCDTGTRMNAVDVATTYVGCCILILCSIVLVLCCCKSFLTICIGLSRVSMEYLGMYVCT